MNAPAITRPAADLRGKVVVITGGAGGIGLATARMAGELGASVVIADLDPARVDSAAGDLARGQAADHTGGAAAGDCLGVAMDVRVEADHARLVQRTLERFGRIDALIACAGILRLRGTPPKLLVDTTTEEFDQVVGINLRGVFLANRAVLPTMIAQRSGTIINLSSVQGLQGRAYDSVYCASKAGVIGLTQAVAEEVRSFGIKVQALMPAAVATPMWEQNKPAPMPGDAIAPERVAEVIAFMLLQPEDTMLVGPVIAPVGARKRKGAG
jgi:3-oxoacyl-[acyl-carrier protein] reductase